MSEYPKKLSHPSGGEVQVSDAKDEAELARYGWKPAGEPSSADLDAVAQEQDAAKATEEKPRKKWQRKS